MANINSPVAASVIFIYDERSGKWEVCVTGCDNEQDVRDAFRAVIISCQQLDQELQKQAPVRESVGSGVYELIPVVR